MVCSVRSSSGKGGSSHWLERLRSNKGFPVLHSSSSSTSTSTTHPPPPTHDSDDSPSLPEIPKPPPPPASAAAASSSFAVITGILSDLFYITPSSSNQSQTKKKLRRKQSSPKILSSPKPLPLPLPPPLILSSNSHNAHKQHHHHPPPLHGFSKTEVTVIDTSSALWKSDKLIFRRKHLWKIKDKTHTHTNKTNFSLSTPHHHITPNNQEYNADHCSAPQMRANAPDSSNHNYENAFTPLHENDSYDPEKKW